MYKFVRKFGFANIADPQNATVRQVMKLVTPRASAEVANATGGHCAFAAKDEYNAW